LIHFKQNPTLYVTLENNYKVVGDPDKRFPRYIINLPSFKSINEQFMLLDNKKYELPIKESPDSKSKERLLNLNFDKKKDEKVNTDTTGTGTAPPNAAGVAQQAAILTLAIFIRFFVVVDIVINLFGKINVELGPRIQDIVIFLKQL
jgi:hypothetical protein